MSNNDYDNRFYNALKRSQPIAFLASFSMITSVFSTTNLPAIYESSVMATIMFLISFILSFTDQFFPHKDPSLADEVVRRGKFFFFVTGVLFLVSIALIFAEDLPEIGTIFYGWIVIAVGLSFLSPVISKAGKFQPKDYPSVKKFKLLIIIGYGSGGGFILAGVIYILNDFAKNKLPDEIQFYAIGISILISIICMITEVILIVKFRKPQKI